MADLKVDKTAPPAVEMRNVTKRFGNHAAVNDVSLKVPDGSIFGLIGPNGAGKTTTFSMIAGYLAPSSGDVYVLDHRPTSVDALKGKLGVLPQDALLPANEAVGDFLTYLARLQGISEDRSRKEVEEVLAEVDGSDWWSRRCGQLSHGMAKRVGIAQALLGHPRVVLLDEPTAGLDPRVAFDIRQVLAKRRGKATLIISSHNLQELEEICDHAAILDQGALILTGSMAELTAAAEEVRFTLARGPVPEERVKAIEGVRTVAWDKTSRELEVGFDKAVCDAEEMIRRVLVVLLEENARISAVSKGRGLEQRVMELTE